MKRPRKKRSQILLYTSGPTEEQKATHNIKLYNGVGKMPTRVVSVNELMKEFENQLTENQIADIFNGK